MDEPCDWDVCTEASTPGPLPQLASRREKKTRAKSVTDRAVEHSGERKPERTQPALRLAVHGELKPRNVSPARESPQSPPQAVQTRKELQDALPKIPPLSSFKSCRSRFMTLEEAERDFHSFITTGLGRSVEVIREFRGREEGSPDDQAVRRESVTLHDSGAQCFKQNGKRWKSDFSRPRSISASSSSHSEDETDQTRGGEHGADAKPQTEARRTQNAVSKPKAETSRSKVYTSAPQIYQTTCASNGRALSQPENYEPVPVVKSSRQPNQTAPAQMGRNESRKIKEKIEKRSKKISEKMIREQKRERDESEHDDEEEEEDDDDDDWSAETYWRASYRAWNDYYASMSPFQEQGYQSYYSVAHNWMAAYRMNAVYMEELLKN